MKSILTIVADIKSMEDEKKTEQNSKYPSQYEEPHYQKYHRG
jgi:hypothetical protein